MSKTEDSKFLGCNFTNYLTKNYWIFGDYSKAGRVLNLLRSI